MADFPKKSLDEWHALAGKELRNRGPEALTWQTPEGIAVKPLYTAEDLEGLETLGGLPGDALRRLPGPASPTGACAAKPKRDNRKGPPQRHGDTEKQLKFSRARSAQPTLFSCSPCLRVSVVNHLFLLVSWTRAR